VYGFSIVGRSPPRAWFVEAAGTILGGMVAGATHANSAHTSGVVVDALGGHPFDRTPIGLEANSRTAERCRNRRAGPVSAGSCRPPLMLIALSGADQNPAGDCDRTRVLEGGVAT
jgi:hypothetical protein